ncbi:MAG TPA: SlyX family protein [Kofleriaceae bacterium]|nr:SlyX family protein [Kofleriaceae bacterium]
MALYHLVGRDEWARAEAAGTYAPATLADEGFIHFSTGEQLARTADRFFAGRADLLVVTVLEDRLAAPVRFEAADGDEFPHLHGPLNLDAVVDVTPWPRQAAPARPSAEDRLVELEVRIAYQDDVIAALNDVVREFTERVARLERELAELRKSQTGVAPPIGPPDDPPPHY